MRGRMMVVAGLALVLGAAVSQGEWQMRVHQGEDVSDFPVSNTDSLTFYERLVPPMVTVPAGVFTMGDGVAYCGTQEHEVTLTRAFYLGQHEVTNQEYLEAVQWAYDHGYVTATTTSVRDNLDGSTQELLDLDGDYCEIAFSGGAFTVRNAGHGINPNHPVKEVSWYGSARYCDWLSLQAGLPRAYQHSGNWACNGGDPYGAQGYRLPTDAEREYAAQWDDERIYPWGNEAPDCSRANFHDVYYCVNWTSPVGSYPDAPATLGLSDMAGNLSEWCNDWHVCSLGTSPVTDPPGPASGSTRVLRGGSWNYHDYELRCADHSDGMPSYSNVDVGFRASRTVSSSNTEDPTEGSARISKSGLLQNRPNPFTPVTKIAFELTQAGRVEFAIYSVDGRLIRTLVDEERLAGSHEVTWDGCDAEGQKVASGVYFYKLAAPGIAESRRMILLP
ncbi:MAG: SUMF1/EgtB/PvdO family nonheme iron enzyme [Candidatus Eisenbacteria bacterium]|nr:SUMF1/EgtB/PvdO family nonheme iron enzyme [Candidatus Eisenbacteria bacterium]